MFLESGERLKIEIFGWVVSVRRSYCISVRGFCVRWVVNLKFLRVEVIYGRVVRLVVLIRKVK